MALKLEDILKNIWQEIYPVGIIVELTVSTSPEELWGGTWEYYGQGKTTIGVDPNDTDFNEIGKTGGNKTKQLSLENYQQNTYHTGGSSISDSISFYVSSGTTYGISNRYELPNKNVPVNLMNPYITIYRWHRIA